MNYDRFAALLINSVDKALKTVDTFEKSAVPDALVFAVCQYAASYPEKFKEVLQDEIFKTVTKTNRLYEKQ